MATGRITALMRSAGWLLPWMLLAAPLAAGPPARPPASLQESDAPEQPPQQGHAAVLSLTPSQQQAVGIRVEEPLALTTAPQIDAFGTVLDPVALVTDIGRVESTRVAAAAAAADAARLERLYRDDTQASLKAVQSARAQAAEATAQSRAAALSFRLQWGPLAALSEAQRRALLDAVSEGRLLLLRADVPGQQLAGALDRRALVEADGANVAARVLGPLPRPAAGLQSTGWLLQVERAPQGLGPGAHTAVRLQAVAAAGLVVPAAALLYGDQGVQVYRQLSASGADSNHFTAVRVRPVARVGGAWLVEGLERSDRVVVQGAGVLWSLQGIGTFSAAEEEHD